MHLSAVGAAQGLQLKRQFDVDTMNYFFSCWVRFAVSALQASGTAAAIARSGHTDNGPLGHSEIA